MNNPFNRQSQFELFPGSVSTSRQKGKSGFFSRSFQLSFENIVVLGIFILMISIVAFSFGVEKGRRMFQKDSSKPIVNVAMARQADVPKVAAEVSQKNDPAFGLLDAKADSLENKEFIESVVPTVRESEKSIDKKDTLEKIHTVQVASFKEKERAQREADTLVKGGYDAFIAPKGSYYIVCVGKFAESQQARTLHNGLRKKYADCYIRSL